MRRTLIDRRTILRGLGGATIPLPFLNIMSAARVARAESAISKTGFGGAPKRFIAFFTPSGQGPDWFKSKAGVGTADFMLSASLSPLERHKKDIIITDGIGNQTAIKNFGSAGIDVGHTLPMMHLLTCQPVKNGVGGGRSIDQEIALQVGTPAKFKSLELGIQPMGTNNRAFAHSGPGIALPYDDKPQNVFKRLFTGFQVDPAALERLRAKQKSILDGVTKDYVGFLANLGGDDRTRVESHLDGIRELEKRFAAKPTAASNVCSVPAAPTAAQGGTSGYIDTGNAHMDLLTMAMACDLTRVATVLHQGAAGNVSLPGSTGLHDCSHGIIGAWNVASKWHAEYFAKFLDRLKAVKEADGSTLLDNTIVFWCSEIGDGNHNYYNMPIVIAGSGGGYLKTGQLVKYPWKINTAPGALYNSWTGGRNHGDLFVTFLNAMGVEATTFGQAQYCTGPLKELVV